MSEKFTVEIISPEKSVIKTSTSEVIIPSYEGEMGIKRSCFFNHLRPGIIKILSETQRVLC